MNIEPIGNNKNFPNSDMEDLKEEKVDLELKHLAPVALRLFLALIFLWFGFTQLLNSQGWISYLPDFLLHTPIDATFFIFLNGSLEVILGIFLILGAHIRLSGLILGLHLLGIAGTIGITAIGVRDIGLGLACIVIAFNGSDFLSLDALIKKEEHLGKGKIYNFIFRIFLGVVALALLIINFYIYSTHTKPKSPILEQGNIKELRGSNQVLSLATVAEHKSAEDCWLIISGKAYNVTPYIQFHPGGKDRIISNCGTDATEAFNTKGGIGETHSVNAHNILTGYLVGNVGEATADSVPSGNAQASPDQTTQSDNQSPPSTMLPKGGRTGSATTPIASSQSTTPTAATVAKHKTVGDCWLIISGKAYNVTQYIPYHPGGQNRIIDNCGKDATTAFNTKGGAGGSHSVNAHNILAGYLIGTIGTAPSQSPTTPAPSPSPISNGAPPTITITFPKSGTVVAGVVTIQVSVSSKIGIFNIQFVLDAQMLGTSNTVPYSISLPSTDFGNGQHTLKAIVTDVQNNTASATVTFTINNPSVPTPTLAPTPVPASGGGYTSAQVATHGSSSDCWLIISGKVYDVTSYISVHPGGANRIISNCGTDATTAFNTKGGTGGAHSSNALSILAGFFIGNVISATPFPTPTPIPTPTSNLTPPHAYTETPTFSGSGSYTASQVAMHNNVNDCWLIITGNIYNVTSYIPVHPGGQNRIISNCGTDATVAFNTKGGTGSPHSTNAHNILAGFLIGTLVSTPTPTPTSASTPTPTPISAGNPSTYTVTVNSSGTLSPSSLTIKAGDTVVFKYTNPGDEQILVFSPAPPSNIKLDHDVTQKSYTFTTTGTYSYHSQSGGANATIIVQ